MYFDEFIQRLRSQPIPPLILLAGDAEDVSDEAQRQLRAAFLKQHPSGTVGVLDGTAHGLSEVLDQARASSLFAAEQLLFFRRAEKRTGGPQAEAALKTLTEYLSDPNPFTTVVLAARGLRKDSKLASFATKKGWFVLCHELPAWKANGWVRSRASEAGLKMPEDAAQALLQKVGSDMGLIHTTLEHLATALHPATDVNVRDVESLPVPGAEPEIFAFLDCVASRKFKEALRWFAEIKRADPSGGGEGVFSLLHSRLRELLHLCALREQGMDEAEVPRFAAMHPFRLKQLLPQARGFTSRELEKALKKVVRLQAAQVTGRLSKTAVQQALELWLLHWGRRDVRAGMS
jgi:DNA polymerase III delta subunit